MMNVAVPLELGVDVAEIIADAIDLAANAIAAIVAVAQFLVHPLEIDANAFELFTGMAAAALAGFIAQVAVPFPKAVHVGAQIIVMPVVVMVTGLENRRRGKQAGNNAKGEDGLFHMDAIGLS